MKEIIQGMSEILFLLLGMGVMEFKAYLLRRKEGHKKESRADIGLLMIKKNDVENYCVGIVKETKADHVAVWRFHNGQHYQGGDSIKKMSIYTEYSYTSSLLVDDISQKFDLENFSKSYVELMKAEYSFLVMETGCCKDWHANKLMFDRGYHTMIWVLLHGHGKNPLGILEISFLKPIDFSLVGSKELDRYKRELEYKIENQFTVA
jgi:hypothetical protein